jgi:chromosomal replication initiator protein
LIDELGIRVLFHASFFLGYMFVTSGNSTLKAYFWQYFAYFYKHPSGVYTKTTMDYQQLWSSALSQVELELSRVNFNTWFKNTRIVDYKEGEVIVGVPNEFVKDWLNQKYHKFILRILRTVHEGVRSVSFSVVKSDSLGRRSQGSIVIQSGAQLPLNDLYVNKDDGLNPRYTFENFVVGSFNDVAYATAQAVLNNLGILYNPFFIYTPNRSPRFFVGEK